MSIDEDRVKLSLLMVVTALLASFTASSVIAAEMNQPTGDYPLPPYLESLVNPRSILTE
jgi:hypothetical protein